MERRRREDARSAPGRDDQQRGRNHGAHAEAPHERRREGRGEAEQQQVDPDGSRELGARPCELLLERNNEHARCGAEPGRTDERKEGGDGYRPGRMKASAGDHAA